MTRRGARLRLGLGGLYEPLDWALIRAPLLPVEAHPRARPSLPGDSLLPPDPRVRMALAVGSPDLFAALARARAADPGATRLRGKLQRYLIRMTTRPTPYGLFAGVGLVRFASVTDLRLAGRGPRTRTRPDMGWLSDLVARLESDIEVRRGLRLFANPSVLVRAGHVFLAEAAHHGTGSPGEAVSLRATGVVRRVLELARTPITHHRLAAELVLAPGATVEKVERLITELWTHTVLLSDLRPPLTCPHPARHVRDRLAEVPAAGPVAEELGLLLAALERWDALPWGERGPAWPPLVEQVRALHPLPPSQAPLQVDLALTLGGRRLHAAVAREAALAGELLLRMSPFPGGVPHLEAYRRAFEARYGRERRVALLELLDPQFGLGLPAAPPPGEGGVDAAARARRDRELRALALRAQRDRRPVLELDDDALERLATWSPGAGASPPPSLDISVFPVARSVAALDAGDFQVVVGPNLGADAAGRGTGRFAELLGEEALAALTGAANAEAARAPDRCWAEVVYSPRQARSANVAVRPAIRRYEIPVGTLPGVPWERVIPLAELLVSIESGRFQVIWSATGAEVAVVAGHMLNPAGAPALVRFLLDAAADRRAQLCPFDWGSAATFPFLPRVQRQRVVLALAQWRFSPGPGPDELAPDPLEAFPDALGAWRDKWSVPRHIYLTAADNRLLLDLEDPACVELLREELGRAREGGPVLLQEALPGPGQAWLPGVAGHHLVELVVPLVLRAKATSARTEPLARTGRAASAPTLAGRPAPAPAPAASSRLRPPGTDWLYLKLYGPPALEDELIAGPLRTFAQFARASGLCDAWFFLRYADPDSHLRIRFHGDPSALTGPLLSQACRWAGELVDDGWCLRFGFQTYERELERYGGARGMVLAEAVFAADSVAVTELLHLDAGRAPPLDRLSLAVLSIDDLLATAGLAEEERLEWCRANAPLSVEDGRDYRRDRADLRRLVAGPVAPDGVGPILAARRVALAGVAAELRPGADAGPLERPVAELCRSWVHLHCNRLCSLGTPAEARALALLRRTRESLARAPVPA